MNNSYCRAIDTPRQLMFDNRAEHEAFLKLIKGQELTETESKPLYLSLYSYFMLPQGEDENGNPVNFYTKGKECVVFTFEDKSYFLDFKDNKLNIHSLYKDCFERLWVSWLDI